MNLVFAFFFVLEVDAGVLNLVEKARALKLSTPPATIQAFGRKACAAFVSQASTETERKKYRGFVASDGWAQKFAVRNRLRPHKTLHGKAGGSIDDEVMISDGIKRVREVCETYDPEFIYSVDEAGLFYRVLPKRAYVAQGEDRKTMRGVEGMKSEDRVTAYLATNATGTRKVPLSLISTAKEPRCFMNRESPVMYFSQSNAWSDVRVFKLWWSNLFLPYVRSVTSEKVLLLMDSHSSHADLVDLRGQVTILELPPNCSGSKHRPMDAGIVAAWKVRYRTKLLGVHVDTMASAPQLREQAEKRKVARGCMGLAEGAQPNLLDAAEMGLAAWQDVSEATVARFVIYRTFIGNNSSSTTVQLYSQLYIACATTVQLYCQLYIACAANLSGVFVFAFKNISNAIPCTICTVLHCCCTPL